MRLVCPNCSAQYEIDGSMIPEEGRDVQCSNCGHTWFELQGPSGEDATPEDDAGLAASAAEVDEDDFGAAPFDDMDADDFDVPTRAEETARRATRPENLSRADFLDDGDTSFDSETDAEAEPEVEAEPNVEETVRAVATDTSDADAEVAEASDTEPESAKGPDTEAETEQTEDTTDDVDDDEPDETVFTAPAKPRRPADAAALDILREEAERELSQRRAPPSDSLETQADLGLETIRNRRTPSRALRARMAHMGETPPEAEPEPEAAQPDSRKSRLVSPPGTDDAYEEPRRDLLPDIEEINSTLKSAPAGAAKTEAAKRSGFRIGFLLVLFVVFAAIFAYAQAPAIARALPDTERAMIGYVDQVNSMRDWIDSLIAGTAQ